MPSRLITTTANFNRKGETTRGKRRACLLSLRGVHYGFWYISQGFQDRSSTSNSLSHQGTFQGGTRRNLYTVLLMYID